MATDGVVTDGGSALDLSLVTGESVPVEVTVGDSVVGGAVNGSGRLIVTATAVGADTVLARIGDPIKAAQHTKAPIETTGRSHRRVFVPIVLACRRSRWSAGSSPVPDRRSRSAPPWRSWSSPALCALVGHAHRPRGRESGRGRSWGS